MKENNNAPVKSKSIKEKLSILKYPLYVLDILVLMLVLVTHLDLIGIQYKEILSGSMSPAINVGDIVFIKHADLDDISVSDVIAYNLGESVIVHRVVEKTDEGLITQGDAVEQRDANAVTDENIEGKVLFHLSNGIAFYNFISSLYFKGFIVILILLNLVLL